MPIHATERRDSTATEVLDTEPAGATQRRLAAGQVAIRPPCEIS